jgi:protein gp37
MGERSGIEWTEATWNPWHGCLKVSPGCKNCYMYTEKARYGQDPMLVVRSKTLFNEPLKWVRSGKPPKFCFTCSWSDFFIEQADDWRAEAWQVIKATPEITYQILTKRPERIVAHLPADWGAGYPNVWLGVSAEDQEYADKRIPLLLSVPAQVRWISAEPLLGPIDLEPYLGNREFVDFKQGLNWVVVGGESGPGARPMHPEWARELRDQCTSVGVAFFFKQWGEYKPGSELRQHNTVVLHNGTVLTMDQAADYLKRYHMDFATVMARVGKKAAGAVLDGREWKEMPDGR